MGAKAVMAPNPLLNVPQSGVPKEVPDLDAARSVAGCIPDFRHHTYSDYILFYNVEIIVSTMTLRHLPVLAPAELLNA